ncbi:MAG: hypothetical protein KDA22_13560 [Phycisphaerales bacterium]|nr:hypothetical protein [Phycisphaerales bacterium]
MSGPAADRPAAETPLAPVEHGEGGVAVPLPSPYSRREKIARLAWTVVQATLFRWSFHTWYRWRRRLLLVFGATLQPTVRIRRTARIECPWNLEIGSETSTGDRATLYCLGKVRIGSGVTISQGAHLCAGSHNYNSRALELLRLPIVIGDDAWIAAEAFVGPGVEVGEGAILAARGVALRNLDPWTIYVGNPAEPVKARERPDGVERSRAS